MSPSSDMRQEEHPINTPLSEAAHRIERVAPLVAPVTNLVQLLGNRMYAVIGMAMLIFFQGFSICLIIFLSSLQRIAHFPADVYLWLLSIIMAINIIGIAAVCYLWVRARE